MQRLGDLVRPIPNALVSPGSVFAASVWVQERAERPVPAVLQGLATMSEPVEIPRKAAGAVLDCYGFEFLCDGHRQDTHRLDNTLRYTCRSGRQRYRSPVRRGLRYLMLRIHGAPGPVRFHDLVLHQSNYPAPEVGPAGDR